MHALKKIDNVDLRNIDSGFDLNAPLHHSITCDFSIK